MLWGIETNVTERFAQAGIPADNISFNRETFTFHAPYDPASFVQAFKKFYGPTMNAFEAAEKNGKAMELQTELELLFKTHNRSEDISTTSIPATYLQVTVQR